MTKVSPRLAATRALVGVLGQGRSLDATLRQWTSELPDNRRALAQELAFGVLRWRRRLEAWAAHLLTHGLRRRDLDVHVTLLTGLYQLFYLDMPSHAAISETVGVARELRKPWAARLLNATLRRAQREADHLMAPADLHPAVRDALPDWLWESLRGDWPECCEAIASAGNARPPMTLRVNTQQGSVADYLERLAGVAIEAVTVPGVPAAITLNRAVGVETLPGFTEGAVTVQDAAAQLAAPLADPHGGERILDACAAPGGKTGHLLELAPDARVTAAEIDPARAERLRGGLARLGRAANIIVADVGAPPEWWDGTPFDAILLDAPCTGTGVIRRHPDIKWLRQGRDIAALAARQQRLLEALWPLLRRGGRLIYATCSVLRRENAGLIEAFCSNHPEAKAQALELPAGRQDAAGWQIFPGEGGMDGFFYASLSKP